MVIDGYLTKKIKLRKVIRYYFLTKFAKKKKVNIFKKFNIRKNDLVPYNFFLKNELFLHIRFLKSNFFITLTDVLGNVLKKIMLKEIDLINLKNGFRSKVFVFKLSEKLNNLLLPYYKNNDFIIIIHGWWPFITKILKQLKIKSTIKYIINNYNKPHNGPRLSAKARK